MAHSNEQSDLFTAFDLLRLAFVAEGTVPEPAKRLHAKEFKSASFSDHKGNCVQ
jgi:hypothetical protein